MVFVSAHELSGVEHSLRTCLHGGWGPQIGEVTVAGHPTYHVNVIKSK